MHEDDKVDIGLKWFEVSAETITQRPETSITILSVNLLIQIGYPWSAKTLSCCKF